MSAPDERSDPETRLAAEIERLRLRMEAGPPLADAELRNRIDAIADVFLALYGPDDATRLPLGRGNPSPLRIVRRTLPG